MRSKLSEFLSNLGVVIDYQEETSELEVATRVIKQTAELGILSTPFEDPTIASTLIIECPFHIVLPTYHPNAKKPHCRLRDLEAAIVCLPCRDKYPVLYSTLWEPFKNRESPPTVDYHSNIDELWTNASLGAVCPHYGAIEISDPTKFVSIRITDVPPLPVHLFWRTDVATSAMRAITSRLLVKSKVAARNGVQ